MLSQQLTLLLYDAKIQDDTSTLLSLSMERNLKAKQSSNKISQIHQKYAMEEAEIQNQIDEISKTRQSGTDENGNELDSDTKSDLLNQYEELKGELKDLKNAEDKEVENVEKESTNYENENDTEQNQVQTDMQATKEDRDAIKENLDQDIEKTFGYFQ